MKVSTLQLITALLLALSLVGCGPSKKELAEREESARRYAALKAAKEAKRVELKERAARLGAAGDERPPKPPVDPGHEIVNCITPKLPDDAIALEGIIGGARWDSSRWNNVICANTTAGQAILDWRTWYCAGEGPECSYSRWRNGEPTFGRYLVDMPGSQGNMVVKTAGGKYEFAPAYTGD